MIMDNKVASLIYLENDVILSKKIYKGWKECQDEYNDDYKTNMAPMTQKELISFFTIDWGEDDNKWPFSKDDIISFYKNKSIVMSTKDYYK